MSQRIRSGFSTLLVVVLTFAVAGVASAGYTNSNDPHGTPDHHARQNHCGCSHVQGSSNHGSPATTQAVTPTRAPGNASPGMPTWYVSPMLISLTIDDTPLPWKPTVGPAMGFTLAYNQMDIDQPQVVAFSNVGPQWTFNWLSYVRDDPDHPGQKVLTYLPRGPGRPEHGFDAASGTFAPEVESAAQLVEVSSDPVVYERRFPDGSKDVYARSDGATVYPRRVFLSKRVDAHGNAVTLHYDDQGRLVAVSNATGAALAFHYDDAAYPLRVSAVTDNHGRTVALHYDMAGRLSGITDVMGMTSTFAYGAGTSITAMTTPYGTTHFAAHQQGVRRWIDITDAGGHHERWEFNEAVSGVPFSVADVPDGINAFDRYLNSRDSFFWDATTLKRFGHVYNKALIYHWNHKRGATSTTSDTLESIKYPLESRIWYNHPGDRAGVSGSLNVPSAVARVLPDGSTQIRRNSYDVRGRLQHTIDPSGLETNYTYAPNGVDVVKIERVGPDGSHSVETFTYDDRHDVLSHTDATDAVTRFTYNLRGQVRTRTDALGHVTRYTYDAHGNLTAVTDPDGDTTRFAYDAWGRPVSKTDPLGRTTQYHYDALNRLVRTTYPDSTFTATTWNKLDKVAVRNREGHVTHYTYDAMRHRTSATDALRHTTHWAYYPNGLLKSRTDPSGHATLWKRDIEGRVTAVVHADGATTQLRYDSADRRTGVTNALGQVTKVAYDTMDRPVRVTRADGVATDRSYTARGWLASVSVHPVGQPGATTRYAYDAHGDRTAITDADSVTTTYVYDANHRLSAVNDALGNTRVLTRDADGRVTAIANAASGSTELAYVHRFAYDAAGERVASIDADGRATRFRYDKAGHPSETIDPLGVHSYTRFDADGRLLQRVRGVRGHRHRRWHPPFGALGATVAKIGYTYDDAGRLTTVTDPGGLVTHYVYDADGHRIKQVSPDTGATTYAYDVVGNRIGTTDARGVKTQRHYDALKRLVAIHYPADPTEDVHYAYGQLDSVTGCTRSFPVGHLTTMTDPSGSTTYCYGARGNVIAEHHLIDGHAHAIAWHWTAANRLAGITYPSGVTVAYQRNAVGRVTSITEQGPHDAAPVTVVSRIGYLPFGPISRMTYGSGERVLTRQYDGNYRGTDIHGLGLDLHVRRNANGHIVALRTRRHQRMPTERYRYDTLQRLTAVTGPWGFARQHYRYNATGDRLNKITARDGLIRYDYQPGTHRLAAIHHGFGWGWRWGHENPFCGWPFGHACSRRGGAVLTDANGNIVQMPHDSQVLSLRYGANNRLTNVTTSQGSSARYVYDGHGRRAEKITLNPNATLQFLYKGSRLLAEYAPPSTDQRAYLWLGRHLIATLDTTPGATTVHYVATDFLGTPRRVTATTGRTVWSWRYAHNAFGERAPQGGYTLNLRFPGQYHDALSGTNYNVLRNYAPATGRYLQSDPLGLAAAPNTYVYVGNNPLAYYDPYGLLWSLPQWLVDGATGFGDGVYSGITFGFGDLQDVRDLLGIDGGVNRCSSAYRYAHFAGTIEGGAALGGGVASKLPKAARWFRRVWAAKGGGQVFERVVSNAELRATQKTGLLRGGREGENFFTNSASRDARRAQQRLGLDGPLRDARIRFRIKNDATLAGPRSAPGGSTGTVGGGREFSTNELTRIQILRVDRLRR